MREARLGGDWDRQKGTRGICPKRTLLSPIPWCQVGVQTQVAWASDVLREAGNLGFYMRSPDFFFLMWQLIQTSDFFNYCLGQTNISVG